MQINNLKLINYRNHKKLSLEFDSKTTLIFGLNGSGKTNILEAIHLLSTTKSFKSEYEKDVITHNHEFSRVEIKIETNAGIKNLEMLVKKSEIFENASSKKVKINHVSKTLSDFAGTLNSVLFSPEDIQIITGSAGGRRKYMDSVLYQIDIQYKRAHSNYTKALRQRNKIIEMISETGKGYDQIDFWTKKILENGGVLQIKRGEMFNAMKQKVFDYGKTLNNSKICLDIDYKKNEISSKRLEQYKEKEIYAKTTLIGPHKDDFDIFMNEFDISNFGSRGQQRSAILALKLAETDFLEEKTGERPILLLDDILSELDDRHREAVNEVIGRQQTIITSAEIHNFDRANVINL